MTDPRRLKDEYAGDLQGQLLRSVDADAPRRDAHGRTLVALGFGSAALGIPAATTATAAAKVGASVTMTMVVKWVGIGIGAAVIAAGTVYEAPKLAGRVPSGVTPREQVSTAAPIALDDHKPASPREPIAPAVNDNGNDGNRITAPSPGSPQGDAISNPKRTPRAVPNAAQKDIANPSPASELVESEPPGLSREVAMLDTARQSVSSDPVGTLRVLDDYANQFPHGNLAPEALVLRIEALVRSGQRSAAEKLAREYLARNPGSPHARKIATLLGGSANAAP
jgi:hypothetical protein